MSKNFYGITDTGRQRDNNEDTFLAERVQNNRYLLACVIDGVGGYEGGEVAAAIARDTILNYMKVPSGTIGTMLKESIFAANEKIYAEKMQGRGKEQMACVLTLAVVDLEGNMFYYAHVGDTRLYLFRDGSLVKITKDQSFVGFLEDSGRLTEEAAMSHPKRNEINNALGFDPKISAQPDYIDAGESPFLPGDLLLLCSDGLTDLVDSKSISAVLSTQQSLEQKGIMLVDAANDAGGKDNITVVLVFNDAPPLKQVATKPAAVKKNESPQPQPLPEVKKGKYKMGWGLPLVILLSICIMAGLAYLLIPKNSSAGDEDFAVNEKDTDLPEYWLNDTLQRVGHLFVLSKTIYGDTVKVSDSIFIDRDTLHFKGNNILFIPASASQERPSLVISPRCRYVLLDSLVIRDFEIIIRGRNSPLHMKNVRLVGCTFTNGGTSFRDSVTVNGRVQTTIRIDTDSINKNRERE
jgi:serine/threonine protein phosphatase PrpC